MKAIKPRRTTNNHQNDLLTEAFLSQINQSYSHKHNNIKHTRRSTGLMDDSKPGNKFT